MTFNTDTDTEWIAFSPDPIEFARPRRFGAIAALVASVAIFGFVALLLG